MGADNLMLRAMSITTPKGNRTPRGGRKRGLSRAFEDERGHGFRAIGMLRATSFENAGGSQPPSSPRGLATEVRHASPGHLQKHAGSRPTDGSKRALATPPLDAAFFEAGASDVGIAYVADTSPEALRESGGALSMLAWT